jgi:hypothetical protein
MSLLNNAEDMVKFLPQLAESRLKLAKAQTEGQATPTETLNTTLGAAKQIGSQLDDQKKILELTNSFNSLIEQNPTLEGNINKQYLVRLAARIADPATGVKEEEAKALGTSRSAITSMTEKLRAWMDEDGPRLTPAEIKQLTQVVNIVASRANEDVQRVRKQYEPSLRAAKIDPEQVFSGFPQLNVAGVEKRLGIALNKTPGVSGSAVAKSQSGEAIQANLSPEETEYLKSQGIDVAGGDLLERLKSLKSAQAAGGLSAPGGAAGMPAQAQAPEGEAQ